MLSTEIQYSQSIIWKCNVAVPFVLQQQALAGTQCCWMSFRVPMWVQRVGQCASGVSNQED